jgi:hypothetical protein
VPVTLTLAGGAGGGGESSTSGSGSNGGAESSGAVGAAGTALIVPPPSPSKPRGPGSPPLMRSVGGAAISNPGPLMPAGGAASSLAFGAGGLAAFRETIAIVLALARISSQVVAVPVPGRNAALRSALASVAAQ